ncbi:MbtH family protein [Streptomyces sp. NBC_00554]|uniref:MbtH family protein n=1 Tax=unclassified Streptomyces TaxID=2593676 RepID=UPI003253905D|nr:MbtH family NRPS accessory protein [Streptomyces sp. NBC_00564]WUC50680.1 MbtH family NRPS accessory protein [Streptomyces sp. NBC_00554]
MPQKNTQQAPEPVHTVVVNAEEQYSVWPALLPVPDGWRETGTRGTRAECLEHIESVWTDLRPLSVR